MKQRETKITVEKVLSLKSENPDLFSDTVGAIGDITEEIIECLESSPVDQFQLLDLVSMNQQYLQELGVSGTDIDNIVGTMMEHSIHGKLTGAGGEGGCVIGFYMP